MARKEDVILIKNIFENGSKEITNTEIGLIATIKFLYKVKTDVTSKDISDALHVSSARMTILLKKLEKGNLVIKEQSKKDARSINIKLTEHGTKKAQEFERSFDLSIEKLLDIFSVEELIKLLENMVILRNVFKENLKIDLKENN